MEKFSLCVSSQTPLIRFSASLEDILQKYEFLNQPLDLANLAEGEGYEFTAGGVTRMVFPLLKRMLDEGILTNPHWVSLNTFGPERITAEGITLDFVKLKKDRMKGYGLAKETMWKALHGIKQEQRSVDALTWQDEFVDYIHYNRLSSEFVKRLDEENDFDLFYMHDFQQLPMAHMLHTLKPKVFRWHIPFDESLIPEMWRQFLTSYLNEYDVVIVSCRKYLDALKRFGYTGEAHYMYPYIDLGAYDKPSADEIERFDQKFGIQEDDRVLLIVARLDPQKGHDRAIKAFARVVRNFPNSKLIIIGDGSFSGSKQGIGLSKAEILLNQLRELVTTLGLEENVVFTGHLTHSELQAAYQRCELTILPSVLEGFGLVVIESWIYKKPTLVSSAAGISELIKQGENGFLFSPDNLDDLADKISSLLSDQDLARSLGKNGYKTSRQCSLERGLKMEAELMINSIGLPRVAAGG
jgi:glycosyltransferase involved in cell wall biosynthesis